MMHYFVPEMMKRRQGSVLLTASDAGLFSIPGMLAYQTSKHAVMGLGTTLRVELSNHNIKLSMLCPAIINTNIICDGRINLRDDRGESAKAPIQEYYTTVSYTHLRAHETRHDLVCRLLLEKKK